MSPLYGVGVNLAVQDAVTQIVQWLVQRGGIDQALRHPDKEAPTVFSRVPDNRTVTRLSATGVRPEHVRTPAAV